MDILQVLSNSLYLSIEIREFFYMIFLLEIENVTFSNRRCSLGLAVCGENAGHLR